MSEQKSEKDECLLVKRKESLHLERRVLMVKKPYDLNVSNISYLNFLDIGTLHLQHNSLLELGSVLPKENTHGLPHMKGLESEKLNFLILPTNLSSHMMIVHIGC